jgi:hypothetical protein
VRCGPPSLRSARDKGANRYGLALVAERRDKRVRSIATLCLFALAAAVALTYPIAGLGICVCCLILYPRPDPPLVDA